MADDDGKKDDCTSKDELMAGPPLPGGARPYVRHRADHSIQTGIMRPVAEGESLGEGAFTLEHIEGDRYAVEEVFPEQASDGSKGPAKVNSKAFRDNWDTIFGKKVSVGQA